MVQWSEMLLKLISSYIPLLSLEGRGKTVEIGARFFGQKIFKDLLVRRLLRRTDPLTFLGREHHFFSVAGRDRCT